MGNRESGYLRNNFPDKFPSLSKFSSVVATSHNSFPQNLFTLESSMFVVTSVKGHLNPPENPEEIRLLKIRGALYRTLHSNDKNRYTMTPTLPMPDVNSKRYNVNAPHKPNTVTKTRTQPRVGVNSKRVNVNASHEPNTVILVRSKVSNKKTITRV